MSEMNTYGPIPVYLDTEFCEKVVQADLLSQVGKEVKAPFYCPRVKTLEAAEKYLSGQNWGNFCLDRINEITQYLAVFHRPEYQCWNDLWLQETKLYDPPLIAKADALIGKGIISERIKQEMVDQIGLIMILHSYEQYVKSPAFEEILWYYMHGHVPCTWKGRYPQGNMLVW